MRAPTGAGADEQHRRSVYAYLADGLTEDLITLLGRVPRLVVRSRHESARLRGRAATIPAAMGRAVNARYLLSGSVRPGSGRLRVDVERLRPPGP